MALGKKILKKYCLYLSVLFIFLASNTITPSLRAQSISDSIAKTTISTSDTLLSDTISPKLPADSVVSTKKISPDAVEKPVIYQCADSLYVDLNSKKSILFKTATTKYEDMNLEADYIELSFLTNELSASGIANEQGVTEGKPIFTVDNSTIRVQEIKYNFTTNKAKIVNVITNEAEGNIHGKYVKRINDSTSYIAHGQYTTCDLDCPHFQIRFKKAKFIQDEKIITGPAYLSFGEIPTFLAIPFGYFPLKKGRASGFVIPSIGESSQGFYLQDGGFYFGISDNVDLMLLADVFTRGSFAVKANSNYVVRYMCKGTVNLSYARNIFGQKYTDDYSTSNDYKIYWSHQQDAKSHPNTRFSALVNVVSSSYNQYNLSSTSDYLSNQYSSTLTFATNAKNVFFFAAAVGYSQSTVTNNVTMTLPDISMSVNQFYPFRKKGKSGNLKWYDNISMRWSSQLSTEIEGSDSLFFKPETWDEAEIGMRHSIPITIPIKIAKQLNWNTNITFNEKWYLQSITKNFTVDEETNIGSVENIFHRNFKALHELTATSSLTTKVYFTYAFKKGGLKAIRHVLSPDLNFQYIPNFGNNTYGTYFNTITGEEVSYSFFEGSTYGGVNNSTQASVNFALNNNLEIKVNSKKDTITGTQKISIFDNVSFSSGYDFAADSLQWKPLTISGRTQIAKMFDITFRFLLDPYILNENGRRVNQTELKVNERALRLSNSDLNIGLNLRINKDLFSNKKKKTQEIPNTNDPNSTTNTLTNPLNTNYQRPDFSNPWNFVINYTFALSTYDNILFYTNADPKAYESTIIQTLNITGDFNVTKKWKIGFTTGYDFQSKQFSYTSFDVYRDLHCWEMRFHWIPFGYRKGWNFTINVKAPALKDLKLDMKQDFRDNL